MLHILGLELFIHVNGFLASKETGAATVGEMKKIWFTKRLIKPNFCLYSCLGRALVKCFGRLATPIELIFTLPLRYVF